MHDRNKGALVLIFGLPVALLVLLQVMLSPTGGLAAMAKYAAVPLVLTCLMAPKKGLWLVSIMGFYGDFYKRLAVYYGVTSMQTVVEVLAVAMCMVGATIVGAVAQAYIVGPKPDRTTVRVLLITVLLTMLLFLSGSGEDLNGRVQYAVNGGLYLGLAAVMCLYLNDRESGLSLCRFQFWLGVPWVFWAVKQYYFGFSDMEWTYARTGLSPVLFSQMIMTPDVPRPFGLASNASAYGAVSFIFMFGVWHVFRSQRHRAAYVVGSLIYLVGLVAAMQRTMLIVPLMVWGTYVLFRTRAGTRLFYAGALVAMLAAVTLSDVFFSHLENANASIASQSEGWSGRVIRITTASDRIKGWARLKKGSSYSLFGTKKSSAAAGALSFADDDYNHDTINKILINYGVVGLLLTAAFLFWLARTAHHAVFAIRDPLDRDLAVFVLAVTAVSGVFIMMSGSNAHTVPINIVLVTFIGLAAGAMQRNAHALDDEVIPEDAQPDGAATHAGVSAARYRMRPRLR